MKTEFFNVKGEINDGRKNRNFLDRFLEMSILIRPENPIVKTVARIVIDDNRVTVLFPEKRDDFRKLVKSFGYSWDGELWYKNIPKPVDCAAELGYHLLVAKFWIQIPSIEVKELIINEQFEKEHRRKIMLRTSGTYINWFVLHWSYGDDFYKFARRITGSRYNKPYVIVPLESYDEIEDFAEKYDFYISPAAQRAISEARELFDNVLTLNIVEKKKQNLSNPTGLIDNDLADKD